MTERQQGPEERMYREQAFIDHALGELTKARAERRGQPSWLVLSIPFLGVAAIVACVLIAGWAWR